MLARILTAKPDVRWLVINSDLLKNIKKESGIVKK